MPKNRNLIIIALVALVNMLGYGIIIPILYSYSKKFGLSDFQNGLLFALFSIFQFISTPIIGRLSDKYGRKPLLLISIVGTAASFFTMAFAPNAAFLFLARVLDGITAGNIPVAFAVISDSTTNEERPRAFGLIGAAFSFGFVFGPAISAFTIGLGAGVPFIIAGTIAVIAVILTYLFLPETNKHLGEVAHSKLFDFAKLWHTLFEPNIGPTFLISTLFSMAFSCAIIYGFQPFTLNYLHFTPSQNAWFFTLFGIVGLISQTFLIGRISKSLGVKKAFSTGILLTSLALIVMGLSRQIPLFIAASILMSLANSVSQSLIPAILSKETDAKSQGTIMGLNASYQSIGTIIGPLLGGVVATFAIPYVFVVGSLLIFCCFLLSNFILRPIKPESAF